MTGAGAFLRARGQNRVDAAKQQTDDRTLLFKDTREWLAYQDAQIAALITRNETAEARQLAQAEKLAAQAAEIAAMQRQNKEQAGQITHLQEQNTQQASQITALTEERQQYISRLAIVTAQKDFIEKENNELRREVERLRGKLPARAEVKS